MHRRSENRPNAQRRQSVGFGVYDYSNPIVDSHISIENFIFVPASILPNRKQSSFVYRNNWLLPVLALRSIALDLESSLRQIETSITDFQSSILGIFESSFIGKCQPLSRNSVISVA